MNVHDYIPISVLTDSYKASHFVQYPDATKMVAVRFLTCPLVRRVLIEDMIFMHVYILYAVWRI